MKIKVNEIQLHKAEGVTKKAVAYSFKEANKILVEWAKGSEVPELSCDKTYFKVIFSEPEYEYKGTFALKKKHSKCFNEPLLQNQIIYVIKEGYGLLPLREHPFPDYYMREREKVTMEDIQEAIDYLKKVDFEDAPVGNLELINL